MACDRLVHEYYRSQAKPEFSYLSAAAAVAQAAIAKIQGRSQRHLALKSKAAEDKLSVKCVLVLHLGQPRCSVPE